MMQAVGFVETWIATSRARYSVSCATPIAATPTILAAQQISVKWPANSGELVVVTRHEVCLHCDREIFYSTSRGMWLHWSTCEPECGTRAEPKR